METQTFSKRLRLLVETKRPSNKSLNGVEVGILRGQPKGTNDISVKLYPCPNGDPDQRPMWISKFFIAWYPCIDLDRQRLVFKARVEAENKPKEQVVDDLLLELTRGLKKLGLQPTRYFKLKGKVIANPLDPRELILADEVDEMISSRLIEVEVLRQAT